MTRVLGTSKLLLLSIWIIASILHSQEVKTEVRIPCDKVKDWFPSGVQPQTTKAPYVLDVFRPDGKSVKNELHGNEPFYGPGQETYTISLNGTRSGNATEKFIGFMISVYNEFHDEESGEFVKPLPAGVSMKECHFDSTSQLIEFVENSTNSNQWNSLQIKWKSPKKYPAGKITIRTSVVREDGVYWDGITLSLNYVCAVPGCNIPGGCDHGLAKTKFGCETCECAGAAGITVRFTSLLLIAFTLFCNLI